MGNKKTTSQSVHCAVVTGRASRRGEEMEKGRNCSARFSICSLYDATNRVATTIRESAGRVYYATPLNENNIPPTYADRPALAHSPLFTLLLADTPLSSGPPPPPACPPHSISPLCISRFAGTETDAALFFLSIIFFRLAFIVRLFLLARSEPLSILSRSAAEAFVLGPDPILGDQYRRLAPERTAKYVRDVSSGLSGLLRYRKFYNRRLRFFAATAVTTTKEWKCIEK